MVGTVEFLTWSGAAVEAAIPVPKTGEKRAEPAQQRVAKARRDMVLDPRDFGLSASAVIGSSLRRLWCFTFTAFVIVQSSGAGRIAGSYNCHFITTSPLRILLIFTA